MAQKLQQGRRPRLNEPAEENKNQREGGEGEAERLEGGSGRRDDRA